MATSDPIVSSLGPKAGQTGRTLGRRVLRAAAWAAALGALGLGTLMAPLFWRGAGGAAGWKADVIVTLGGSRERAPYARTLVERGVAPRLVLTLFEPGCLESGRPAAACRSGVENTVDEALFMRGVLGREGVSRAVIVTSRSHLLRATAVFGLVFAGSGIELAAVAAPGPPASWRGVGREAVKLVPSLAVATTARLRLLLTPSGEDDSVLTSSR